MSPSVGSGRLAVGVGGHGFQHSPATGHYVAEWIVDGKPSIDLSRFDGARFPHDRAPRHARGVDAE